jgi:hypothetical protein
MPDAAALTGDLVGSRQVDPQTVEAAFDLLKQASDEISHWFAATDGHFTRYRGDGWQIHLSRAGYGLRGAVYIIARLRAAGMTISTRVAIGVGAVDSLGSDSLADARGPAFEAAGHALDMMTKTQRLAVQGPGIDTFHRIIVELIDERIGRWSREQAEAIALYLHPDNPTLADLATTLGISTQAVSYRLSGAGASVLRRSLRSWENAFDRSAYGERQP